MPSSSWELDDFEARFATSAVNPHDWWGPAERGTHWVFVDEAGYEAFWKEWCKPVIFADDPVTDQLAVNNFAAAIDHPRSTILRLPEVVKRTGLSKSTIYAKIANRTFPAQILLGSRTSGWQDEHVQSWIRNPT
ncbi:AlpA family phage regulatory protein [Polymorphobacter megasporae]|nr:AlpA family phage regulatory protein [Polymorphobacter megasporae]